jgi:hypothetical protein
MGFQYIKPIKKTLNSVIFGKVPDMKHSNGAFNEAFLLPPIYMADYELPADNMLIVVSTVWLLLGENTNLKVHQNLTLQVYILSRTLA